MTGIVTREVSLGTRYLPGQAELLTNLANGGPHVQRHRSTDNEVPETMRRLMLLRHAKSAWPRGVEDHERPLAKRGLRAGMTMGDYMARNDLMPGLAIVSTARRARETWDLVRPAFPKPMLGLDERRIYEAPAAAILEVVRETAAETRTLLLVGHNAGLQDLALYLTGTADADDLARLRKKYPTGGLAVIDFDTGSWKEVGAGAGRLERFATPKSVADPG